MELQNNKIEAHIYGRHFSVLTVFTQEHMFPFVINKLVTKWNFVLESNRIICFKSCN